MNRPQAQQPHAQFDRIMALIQAGALQEAQQALDSQRKMKPRDINLLNLAAWLATLRGDQVRAVALYKQVLAQQPDQPQIRFNLHRAEAIIAEQAGDLPQALQALQAAARLVPQDAQVKAQAALIERQLCIFNPPPPPPALLNPAAAMVLLDDPAAQAANARRWAQQLFGSIKPLPPAPPPADGPIRIGFLTSDLHDHATAYLIAEFFELLDRQRFTPYLYSYGVASDAPIRQRILAACPDGGDLRGLDAPSVAARIRADGIMLLVDLKGYTRGGRLDILAYRPAPVQLHWLGFPGTLGCPFIDYFIADATVLPPPLEPHFSEKIIRLPASYQCNDRQRPLPPPAPRAAFGLPADKIIFASLNQTYKLHPALLDDWAAILAATPDSILWLLASNAIAPDNIRSAFAARGIAPERLVFAAPIPLAAHLQRYHAVDIALDTHPIGGHTTTSDALWLGVPVVSYAGPSFVSRVAASLLNAVHLPELVTDSPRAYRDLAIALAADPARRMTIKTGLVKNRLQLPLFTSEIYVQKLMAGLESAWACHRHGLAPAHITVE